MVASDRSATIVKRRAPAGTAGALAVGAAGDDDVRVGAGGDACGVEHETRPPIATRASAIREGMRTSGRPRVRTPPRRTVIRRAGDGSQLPLVCSLAGFFYLTRRRPVQAGCGLPPTTANASARMDSATNPTARPENAAPIPTAPAIRPKSGAATPPTG